MAKLERSPRKTANFLFLEESKRHARLLDKMEAAREAWEPLIMAIDFGNEAADELVAALKAGDVDRALLAAHSIGFAEGASDPVLWESARQTLKCRAGRKRNTSKQKTERQERVNLACELLAEFDPADVKKKGKATVHKEIGEIMALRLELPEPIRAETVRDYLKPEKNGED